jgi:hypothetical protein
MQLFWKCCFMYTVFSKILVDTIYNSMKIKFSNIRTFCNNISVSINNELTLRQIHSIVHIMHFVQINSVKFNSVCVY